MGHLKFAPLKPGGLSRSFEMGLELRRVTPEGEAPAAEEAPEPGAVCLPNFVGWNVTTDPYPLDGEAMMAGYDIVITPQEGNDTCGGCLEWSSQVLYYEEIEGEDPPTVESIVAHEDCIGATVTMAPQVTPSTYLLAMHATLNGQPYGRPAYFTTDAGELIPTDCWLFGGDVINVEVFHHYPNGVDWTITIVFLRGFTGTFAWNYSETPNPHPFGDVTITEDLDPGLLQPRLTITNVWSGNDRPEDFFYGVTTAPTIDGTPLDEWLEANAQGPCTNEEFAPGISVQP